VKLKWEQSIELRKEKTKDMKLFKIFEKYSCLSCDDGYNLIEYEFRIKHPEVDKKLIAEFDSFAKQCYDLLDVVFRPIRPEIQLSIPP
jgi:hypothetical protein